MERSRGRARTRLRHGAGRSVALRQAIPDVAPAERFDQQRVLRHREDVLPDSLPVPARDAREAMGDVFDLDVQRRGVEEIEPAPREHALPGTRRLSGHPTAAAAGRSAALAPSPIARRLPPRAWWLRQFLRRAPPR